MPSFGAPELIILAIYALVIVGIVYGAYRLIRLAIRREIEKRDGDLSDRDRE